MLDICLLGTGGMMPLPYRWLTSMMARCDGSSLSGAGSPAGTEEAETADILCGRGIRDRILKLGGLKCDGGRAVSLKRPYFESCGRPV